MRVVVLDSWAVLALLRGERPAVQIVGHYVNQAAGAEAKILISVINLGEVLYRSREPPRRRGTSRGSAQARSRWCRRARRS
jgi:hypothetical protein